jgi:hypothetical protein
LKTSKIQADILKSEKENQNSEFQKVVNEKTVEYGKIRVDQTKQVDNFSNYTSGGIRRKLKTTSATSYGAQSDIRRINESVSIHNQTNKEMLHLLKLEGSQTGSTETKSNTMKAPTEAQTFQKTETISTLSIRIDTEEPKFDPTHNNNLENESFTKLNENEPKKKYDDENRQWNKPKIKIEQEVNKELKELSPKHMNNLQKMKIRPVVVDKNKLEVLRLMEENNKLLRDKLNLIMERRAAKRNRAKNILILSKEELFIQDNKDPNGEADTQLKDESSNQIQFKNQIPKNNPLHMENHRVLEEELSGSIDFYRNDY